MLTVVAHFHDINAGPGTDLAAEHSIDSVAGGVMTVWANVHGEAAPIRQVHNPPGVPGLGPRRKVLQCLAALSLQIYVSITRVFCLLTCKHACKI